MQPSDYSKLFTSVCNATRDMTIVGLRAENTVLKMQNK